MGQAISGVAAAPGNRTAAAKRWKIRHYLPMI
jgi:hypothetical protein